MMESSCRIAGSAAECADLRFDGISSVEAGVPPVPGWPADEHPVELERCDASKTLLGLLSIGGKRGRSSR